MKNTSLCFLFSILSATHPCLAAIPTETPSDWQTYTDKQYGFTIQFPANIRAANSFNKHYLLNDNWRYNNEAPPSNTGVALLSIPYFQWERDGYYDLQVRLGVSANKKEVANCLKGADATQLINGIHFSVFNYQDAAMSQGLKVTSYRTIHYNKCYALEQVETFSQGQMTTRLIEANLFDQLLPIIQTFTFIKSK